MDLGLKAVVLTRQIQDLVEGEAVVQRRGDHTVRPQPLGPQLVHLLTGVHAILTGDHPLVGRRGDEEAHPAEQADQKAGQLQASVRHHPTDQTLTVNKTKTDLQIF